MNLAELNQTITDLTVVYYGTSDTCPKGDYYLSLETRWSPPFVIVHPDDLDNLRKIVYPAKLVHLSQEPLESIHNRLTQYIRPMELEDPYPQYSYFQHRYKW
jgi:hypothetical protein